MAQTVTSFTIYSGGQRIIFEKPRSLRRIFYGITVLAGDTVWRLSKISFDDPTFSSYYVLDGQFKHFEAEGDGISQGDIWVRNTSGVGLFYTATEILL